MMSKLTEDLKKITTLDDNTLTQLTRLTSLLIGQYIYEDTLKDSTMTKIDLGYGTLYISTQNGEIKTRFILNEDVVKDIKGTLRGNTSKFKQEVNNRLTYKLANINEELI